MEDKSGFLARGLGIQPSNDIAPRFDYALLDQEDILHVKRRAKEVKELHENKGVGIIRGREVFPIGAILLDVNKRIQKNASNSMRKDTFPLWLSSEVGISEHVARKYMKITACLGDRASKLGNVPSSVLYELTLPLLPSPLLEMILSGTYLPNLQEVKQMRIPERTRQQRETLSLSEAKQQIGALHMELHSVTCEFNILRKEHNISEHALLERNEEIEKLQEKIEKLEEDKKNLSDKNLKDRGKLNRIIIAVHQISNEE